MSKGFGWWPGFPSDLYRDPDHGKVAGVCAGLGAYFQVRPKFIRLAFILGSVFGLFIPLVLAYVLLTVLLPPQSGISPAAEQAGSRVGGSSGLWGDEAGSRIDRLTERFRSLDRRLASMEAQVTSDEFLLRQKFREL
ncbi:PspC domain-containing protein [Telmatospirillum sp.]|uniref:PspC domain-containing protein n=1 Tax=Telmatospirillum sp. TaxID=2079197 RepID=UPI0028467906|nr:PspC domain-containing protein [Telmatospirillum sp.]MDR3440847.1 PspC domain-containing protein [Telmatospirillum sp.]